MMVSHSNCIKLPLSRKFVCIIITHELATNSTAGNLLKMYFTIF
ncbi:unnamed protein product [Blumeria hordei]|uniref:Uncharacterized protein n=1 Tax=Blumeria hordei TaxID=2867405 RepID=A0A383V2V7_BLUHO|nr:unnamed protein product [Blumeria hordei]